MQLPNTGRSNGDGNGSNDGQPGSSAAAAASASSVPPTPTGPRLRLVDLSNVPNYEDVHPADAERVLYEHEKTTCPMVDIKYTANLHPGRPDITKNTQHGKSVPARLFIAFGRKARRLYSDLEWRERQHRPFELEKPYPNEIFHLIIAWMIKCCKQKRISKLQTPVGVVEWLQLWFAVEELEIPLGLQKLAQQAASDCSDLSFDEAKDAYHFIRPDKDTDYGAALTRAIEGRLAQYTRGQVVENGQVVWPNGAQLSSLLLRVESIPHAYIGDTEPPFVEEGLKLWYHRNKGPLDADTYPFWDKMDTVFQRRLKAIMQKETQGSSNAGVDKLTEMLNALWD